jgi:hypothetical protein
MTLPCPLWFVLVLLIYSGGYTAWRAGRPARSGDRPLTGGTLAGLAAVIAVGTVPPSR